MADLFIKRRKLDGTFGVLEPVVKGGKTTEEKLKEQIEKNEQLEEKVNQAIMELTMLYTMGG